MVDFTNVKIAVDFDGTIVDHEYPAIGKEKLFAFQTLKELDEAVEYCRKNGIEFYAVNRNYPEEIFTDAVSRKIDADIFIDDRNLGGFPGWSEAWQILVPFELHEKMVEKKMAAMRKSIFRRLFGKWLKQDEKS